MKLETMAEKLTNIFVFGVGFDKQLQTIKILEENFTLKFNKSNLSKEEEIIIISRFKEKRFKMDGTDKDKPSPFSCMLVEFRNNRGTYEKEYEAVLGELKFWYKEV